MLMPKRVKHRKVQRGRMRGKATRGNTITYGQYAMQAMEPAWITSNQIEAARIAMTRYSKRGGKVWIKIFPDKPVTSKPAETRMGSGKGSPEYWVAVVKPGRVMFEIAGVSEEVAREAIRLAGHKLPCRVRFIKRDDIGDMEPGETPGEMPDEILGKTPDEILDEAPKTQGKAPGEAPEETPNAQPDVPIETGGE